MHLNPDTIVLARGAHSADSGQACVMELACCLAGEEWSDSPKCVSPLIAVFLRNWNDNMSDEDRQQLKALVPVVMNTATGEADDMRRSWMATDWLIRVHVPAWLEMAGLKARADGLCRLAEITDPASLGAAMGELTPARAEADAAGAAAGAAAWAAAGAAAGAAAWTAAGAAAWTAAGAAACAAAGAAACAAAGAAARAKLRPTVAALQSSALDLIRRMSDVGRK